MSRELKTGTILSTHWHKGFAIHFELLRYPSEYDAVVYCRELDIEMTCKSWDDIKFYVDSVRDSIDLKLTRNDSDTRLVIDC